MQHNILRFLLTLALSGLIAFQACAQGFVWEMPPSDFSNIERLTKGLFKVERNGKIGVVKPDGTPVVDVVCSEITPFYENRALLLVKEGEKDRIIGNISISGQICLFSNSYYALADQRFYSDGLLSVENENGEKGYIDGHGNEVVGFNGDYDIIKPFSEGYAAVFHNKEYTLINKSGARMRMVIGIGEVCGGTNVYNGSAYIWDSDGKFYTYDTKDGKCRHAHKPNSGQVDYLYCLSEISKRDKIVPYEKVPSGNIGLTPLPFNGKYGYSSDEKVLLESQFTRASPVEDGYAIVILDGKYGILKYLENIEPFSISNPHDKIEYLVGATVDCYFSVSIPSVYNAKKLDIIVRDGDMNLPVNVNLQDHTYSFNLKPRNDIQVFTIVVFSEGLLVTTANLTYHYKKKHQELPIPNKKENKKSDAKKDDIPKSIFIN